MPKSFLFESTAHAVHTVASAQVEHLLLQAIHAATGGFYSPKPSAHLYKIIFKINTHKKDHRQNDFCLNRHHTLYTYLQDRNYST